MTIDEITCMDDYSNAIADYLCAEYGDISKELPISTQQRNTIGSILNYCYDNNDSVNNAANYLMEFVRKTQNESSQKHE